MLSESRHEHVESRMHTFRGVMKSGLNPLSSWGGEEPLPQPQIGPNTPYIGLKGLDGSPKRGGLLSILWIKGVDT